jgi:PHD/YefM family antitoxin component YafN of YafNO toxin-antitoxin module
MKTVSTTQASTSLYELIDEIANSHQPILIKGKGHNAILLSQEDWNAIQETLYLSSIPGMRKSIIEGLETPITECETELDW